LNFSVSYPLKRHAFQRVGVTYSLSKSSITAFSTASQTFFQTISFRSGIQGRMRWPASSTASCRSPIPTTPSTIPVRPRTGKEYTAAFQFVRHLGQCALLLASGGLQAFIPMHYLQFNQNGHNVLGIRAQLGYVQGFGGDVAPPNNRFYAGGENELRGFDVRRHAVWLRAQRVNFQLTNPDGQCVPRDPTNPEDNQCIQVPLPVYGVASIGGDTNLNYRTSSTAFLSSAR
jgi:outer membrane protein insertion porin family